MHPGPSPPPFPVPSTFPLPRQPGLGLGVAAPVEPTRPYLCPSQHPEFPRPRSNVAVDSESTRPCPCPSHHVFRPKFPQSLEHRRPSQYVVRFPGRRVVSAPTSQSSPPPGSAANVGANISLAAVDNTAPSSSPCTQPARPAAQPQLPYVTPTVATNMTPIYKPPSAPQGQDQNAKPGVMGHPSQATQGQVQIQACALALVEANTQGQAEASRPAPRVMAVSDHSCLVTQPATLPATRRALQQRYYDGQAHSMPYASIDTTAASANGDLHTTSYPHMHDTDDQGQNPTAQHFAAATGQPKPSLQQPSLPASKEAALNARVVELEAREESRTGVASLRTMVPIPSALKVDDGTSNNMNKLSSLIDRLQKLTSAAPSDLRPQLHRQVAMLRSSFKKQQERCLEFLRLTEEYANRYLLDISAEIEQQRSFLEMLEKRLDMAKTLHGQAMDLRRSYESGTVDAMKEVRKRVLLQPLPEDFDLLKEVDFVLSEIRRCYTALDKFWTEEIRRAAKALESCCVDPDDAKQWRDLKASLEQTIPSNKTIKQGSSTWSIPQLPSSSGPDLGAIASALFPALAMLEETLRRVRASSSIAFSPKSFALALRVGCGSTQNKESCLAFFRRCIGFAETVAAPSAAFMAQPTFSRLRVSNDLQKRVVALGSAVDFPTESATQFQGSRRAKSAYQQCLSLQRGTTHELNTLLENVSCWIVFADGLPNVPPGGSTLGLLHELADTWEKGRASLRKMLAALTDDPAERLRCQTLSLALPRPRFFMIDHPFSFA